VIFLACVGLIVLAIGMAAYALVRPTSAEYQTALLIVVTVAAILALIIWIDMRELARDGGI
jgi:uncharacterized membrane protein